MTDDLEDRLSDCNDLTERQGFFLDLMNHDINNLNQIVLGYLELILTFEDLDPNFQRYLQTAFKSVRDSAGLIGKIQILRAIDNPALGLEKVEFIPVLKEVIEEFKNDGQNIESIIRGGEGKYIEANEFLKEVFSNLLENGIKHSQNEPELRVICEESDGKYFKISFEDNGKGVSDDMKSLIFFRFKKGSKSVKGKGVGLHLVRTIIERYGGKICLEDRVEGDPAQGSSFIVFLPMVD